MFVVLCTVVFFVVVKKNVFWKNATFVWLIFSFISNLLDFCATIRRWFVKSKYVCFFCPGGYMKNLKKNV